MAVLYLFSGHRRQQSIGDYLQEEAQLHGMSLRVQEVDLLQDEKEDLTLDVVQEHWLRRISNGEFSFVLVTPPCSTFSRVRMANLRGPPPLRCREHPRGFPWASKRHQKDIECGNIMVDFMIKVFQLAQGMARRHYCSQNIQTWARHPRGGSSPTTPSINLAVERSATTGTRRGLHSRH